MPLEAGLALLGMGAGAELPLASAPKVTIEVLRGIVVAGRWRRWLRLVGRWTSFDDTLRMEGTLLGACTGWLVASAASPLARAA